MMELQLIHMEYQQEYYVNNNYYLSISKVLIHNTNEVKSLINLFKPLVKSLILKYQ